MPVVVQKGKLSQDSSNNLLGIRKGALTHRQLKQLIWKQKGEQNEDSSNSLLGARRGSSTKTVQNNILGIRMGS